MSKLNTDGVQAAGVKQAWEAPTVVALDVAIENGAGLQLVNENLHVLLSTVTIIQS